MLGSDDCVVDRDKLACRRGTDVDAVKGSDGRGTVYGSAASRDPGVVGRTPIEPGRRPARSIGAFGEYVEEPLDPLLASVLYDVASRSRGGSNSFPVEGCKEEEEFRSRKPKVGEPIPLTPA